METGGGEVPKVRKAIEDPEFESPRGYNRPNYNWVKLLHPLTLKKKLYVWCVMPISYSSQAAANTAAWRIRSGDVRLPEGIWEARAKEGRLYVRYMGKGE